MARENEAMRKIRVIFLLGLSAALGFAPPAANAISSSFSVSASNTTMPASGYGNLLATLKSIDGYSGDIRIDCAPENPPKDAKLPACLEIGPWVPLGANATVNQDLVLVPPGAIPPPQPQSWVRPLGAAPTLALGGLLLFGLRRKREWPRWFSLILVAAATVVSSSSILACGSGENEMSPGTFPYSIVATDVQTNISVTTTANVTIP